MFAIIDKGRVVDISSTDPTGHVHPILSVVPCPTGTSIGDLFDGANFTKPPAQPRRVPPTVSIVQATLALHALPGKVSGTTMLDDVNALVAGSNDPRIALAWARATSLDRYGLFVTQLAPGLNLDDTALDSLFIAAAGISV